MRHSNQPFTIVLLFLGIAVAVALSIATGAWMDAHRPLGSHGVIAFLLASGAIFVCVEAIAGVGGNWIARHRLLRS